MSVSTYEAEAGGWVTSHRIWLLWASLGLLGAAPAILSQGVPRVEHGIEKLRDVAYGITPDVELADAPLARLWIWVARSGNVTEEAAVHAALPAYADTFESFQYSILVLVSVALVVYFYPLLKLLFLLARRDFLGALIAVELGLVLWMVFGGMAGMGLPGLFWNPGEWFMMPSWLGGFPVKLELAAAFGVTLFVAWMFYLLFLMDYEWTRHAPERSLWRRFAPILRRSGLPSVQRLDLHDAGPSAQVAWFLGFSSFPALIALAVPALLPSVRWGDFSSVVAWQWLVGMAAAVMFVALIVATRAGTRYHVLWQQVKRCSFDPKAILNLDAGRFDSHANYRTIILVITIVFLFSFLPGGRALTARLIPAAVSVCVVLGVTATTASWLATRSKRIRLIVCLSLLGLMVLAGSLEHEVILTDLVEMYPSPGNQIARQFLPSGWVEESKAVSLSKYQKDRRTKAQPDFHKEREDKLKSWHESLRDEEKWADQAGAPVLVVVTTSGGALRAGLWTRTVLETLENELPNFHRHVRLITGASGGMLGASHFVANQAVREYEKPENSQRIASRRGLKALLEAINAKPGEIKGDYLSPIAWQITFRDFIPWSLAPWPTWNRGDELERAWKDSSPALGFTFGDLTFLEDVGRIPSIVFSPMMVEDGRRLLISNLPLADLTENSGEQVLVTEDVSELTKRIQSHDKSPEGRGKNPSIEELEYPSLASLSAVDGFDLLKDVARDRITLASAVRMSATFPYVTSVVTLPTNPPRHIVDAGYYDNYGVNIASAWLVDHAEWLSEYTAGVLVVQIRAFRNEKRIKILQEEIHSRADDEKSLFLFRFLPSLFSSLIGSVRSLLLPVEGVAKARESSMYFRNDEQLIVLQKMFKEKTHDPTFFQSVVFTCDTLQPGLSTQNVETLNWYIDPNERHKIEKNMEKFDPATQIGRDRNDLRLKRVTAWWNAHNGKPK